LAAWFLFGLLRMTVNREPAGAATPHRTGFVPGLLGGMFGSVAGFWIYDTFPAQSPAAASGGLQHHSAAS
jgi:hypothetical protein